MNKTERRKMHPNLTDKEFIRLMMSELKELNNQYDNPNEYKCKHCILISINERYNELRKIGYLKKSIINE